MKRPARGHLLAAGGLLVVLAALGIVLMSHARRAYGVFSDTETLQGSLSAASVVPPTELACTKIGIFRRRLEWQPAPNADGYLIYHDGPFGDDEFDLLARVNSPRTTYNGVRASFFPHRWHLTSFFESWESGAGDTIEVHCRPVVYFPRPCGLHGHNHHSQRTVALTWDPSLNAAFYGVFRAAQSGGPYELVATAETSSYDDYAVADGSTYYYVVVAVDGVGNESDPSAEIAVPDDVLTPSPGPAATATLEPTPTNTPTPTPRATAIAVHSPTGTATATSTATATATAAPTATATPEPTATEEPTATSTAQPTATAPPQPSPTAQPAATSTALPTATTPPRQSPTAAATATSSAEPTSTPTPTALETPAPDASPPAAQPADAANVAGGDA